MTFAQVSQLLAEAAQHDPNVNMNIDMDTATRDAILGIGAPATWLNPEEQVEQGREAAMMQQAMMAAQEQGMPVGEEQPTA